jgi:hypothetical protein
MTLIKHNSCNYRDCICLLLDGVKLDGTRVKLSSYGVNDGGHFVRGGNTVLSMESLVK